MRHVVVEMMMDITMHGGVFVNFSRHRDTALSVYYCRLRFLFCFATFAERHFFSCKSLTVLFGLFRS